MGVISFNMFSDLRFTFRSLAKSPGFAFIAIVTLGVGLGVNTTMFSITNALLFRGLPYEEADRLVALNLANPEHQRLRMDFSMQEFWELRDAQSSFEGVFSSQSGTFNVSGGEVAPERFTGTWMNGRGLDIIGAQPLLGRWWTEEEDVPGAAPVVVISENLWRTRFGAAVDVIGQTLRVNGELATVIGVTRGKFDFPAESDVWTPRRYDREAEERDDRYLDLTARLRDGVGIEEARREVEVIFARWVQAHPEDYEGLTIRTVPLREEFFGDSVRRMLAIMMTAVTMVLLIACTNVANLLLARGGARLKEMAVRSALGATRARTIRLLLMESLVLALGGALLALPIAYGLLEGFDYAMARSGDNPPSWLVWEMDFKVLLYVVLAAVFTCVAAGIMPAVRLARPNLSRHLNDASRGSTGGGAGRLTRALVVAEVAFSCVLLVGSGLMIRSVVEAADVDLGYSPDRIMSSRIGLPEAQYSDEAEQVRFFEELIRNVNNRPEVASAGLSSRLPTWDGSGPVLLEDSPLAGGERQPRAGAGYISPGWLNVMGVEVLRGRDFDERDDASRDRVAVVNAKLAEEFWPGESAVGKRFKRGQADDVVDAPWVTVVGVIPSIYQGDFEDPVAPEMYLPQAQGEGLRYYSLMVRMVRDDDAAAARLMREEVRRLDPDLPIYWVQPLQVHLDEALFFKRLFAWIFGIFGGVALLLAAIGIYGVMAFGVSQRTQEIGVRMALGAAPGNVLAMVLGQGGRQLGLGLVIGLVLAFFTGNVLEHFLFQVEPTDPTTFVVSVVVLLLAALPACLLPALRALRVNPMMALRAE